MKTRKKKTIGKRKKRQKLIVVSTVLVIAVAIAVAVLSMPKSNPEMAQSKDYFEIHDIFFFPYPRPENTGFELQYLTFNITAVGGDATRVYIPGGMRQGPAAAIGKISQGESVMVDIEYSPAYYSKRDEQGFPVRVYVSSDQAEGEIVIYLPLFLS